MSFQQIPFRAAVYGAISGGGFTIVQFSALAPDTGAQAFSWFFLYQVSIETT